MKGLELAISHMDSTNQKGRICFPIHLKIGVEYVNLLNINR